jgi:hypothetical protein
MRCGVVVVVVLRVSPTIGVGVSLSGNKAIDSPIQF